MLFNYLIDEGLPSDISFWNNPKFTHAVQLDNITYDTDIWQYARNNDLIIITSDTDFYYRAVASSISPKVVWIRADIIKIKKLNKFIERAWPKVERHLLSRSFIKLKRKK
ncbi:MAG: DUF5615 family PIN-like protein [Ginsengibacter sp.]